MTDRAFEAAVRAASLRKPPGMGDFAVREMVRAALDAARQVPDAGTAPSLPLEGVRQSPRPDRGTKAAEPASGGGEAAQEVPFDG